jgi:hypothetical protein
MGEQTFDRIKKTLGILLVVFFVASLTAAAVSAAPYDRDGRDGYDHDDHYGHGHGNDWYHGDDWYRHHGYHWWRNHWWDDDWWRHNRHY